MKKRNSKRKEEKKILVTWKHLQNGVQSAQFSKKRPLTDWQKKTKGRKSHHRQNIQHPLEKKDLERACFHNSTTSTKEQSETIWRFVALVVFFPGIFEYCTHTHSDVLFGGLDCTENKILKRKLSEEHFWKRWIFCVKSGSVCFYWAGLEELKLKCIQREHVWTSEKIWFDIDASVWNQVISRGHTHSVINIIYLSLQKNYWVQCWDINRDYCYCFSYCVVPVKSSYNNLA